MLESIKKALHLLPKETNNNINLAVGTQGDKIIIKLTKKTDTIVLDRIQLTNLLSALASRASLIK